MIWRSFNCPLFIAACGGWWLGSSLRQWFDHLVDFVWRWDDWNFFDRTSTLSTFSGDNNVQTSNLCVFREEMRRKRAGIFSECQRRKRGGQDNYFHCSFFPFLFFWCFVFLSEHFLFIFFQRTLLGAWTSFYRGTGSGVWKHFLSQRQYNLVT